MNCDSFSLIGTHLLISADLKGHQSPTVSNMSTKVDTVSNMSPQVDNVLIWILSYISCFQRCIIYVSLLGLLNVYLISWFIYIYKYVVFEIPDFINRGQKVLVTYRYVMLSNALVFAHET